jgi:hypothetical protein
MSIARTTGSMRSFSFYYPTFFAFIGGCLFMAHITRYQYYFVADDVTNKSVVLLANQSSFKSPATNNSADESVNIDSDVTSNDKLDESVLFSQRLKNYPWKDNDLQNSQFEELIHFYSEFAIMEPTVPVSPDCQPPELTLVCEGEALTGTARESPVKMAHIIQFGFDVDTLEVLLHELHGVVDHLVLLEATVTHGLGNLKKDLIWEKVKHQERFGQFKDMVIHLVLDDSDVESGGDDIWVQEGKQEKLRWSKFLQWNEFNNFYSDSDLVSFGDTDEVPSRLNMYKLKHCEMSSDQVDIGIWFPWGDIKTAFKPDWPVRGHPYTLGDPTVYTIGKAKLSGNPTRQRGRSGSFLLGGMHMTQYNFMPYIAIKYLTMTETSQEWARKLLSAMKKVGISPFELQNEMYQEYYMLFSSRVKNLENAPDSMDKIAVVPWFLECNLKRYPGWVGEFDERLK